MYSPTLDWADAIFDFNHGLPNREGPRTDASGTGSGGWLGDVSPAESTISLPAFDHNIESFQSSLRVSTPHLDGDDTGETVLNEFNFENKSRRAQDLLTSDVRVTASRAQQGLYGYYPLYYPSPQYGPPATNVDSLPCLTINPMALPINTKPEDDAEVESESDGSADSDSEYAPPSVARSCKRGRSQSGSSSSSISNDRRPAKRAAYPYPWSQSSSATPPPQSSPAPSRQRASRRERQPPPARNIQVTSDFGDVERLNFRCPVNECTYKNTSRRLPDFKRHLNSHRGVGAVRCVGVRVSDVSRFPVLKNAKPYDIGVEGEEDHVGGCMRSFSRSDALARHVKNGPCAHYNKA